jgi:hypothetical protein
MLVADLSHIQPVDETESRRNWLTISPGLVVGRTLSVLPGSDDAGEGCETAPRTKAIRAAPTTDAAGAWGTVSDPGLIEL